MVFGSVRRRSKRAARTVGLSALEAVCAAPLPGGPDGLLDLLGRHDNERAQTLERLFQTCTDEELGTLMLNVQQAVVRRSAAASERRFD